MLNSTHSITRRPKFLGSAPTSRFLNIHLQFFHRLFCYSLHYLVSIVDVD